MYARIDETNSVIEYNIDMSVEDENDPNIVKVDTEYYKPNISWNEILFFNEILYQESQYRMTYTVSQRHERFEDKIKTIKILLSQYTKDNRRRLEQGANKLKQIYSDSEILSWDQQIREARNYLNGNTNDIELIKTVAEERGITLDYFANKIIEKAREHSIEYGKLLGKYQKNIKILESIDLNDESTFDNIDLYEW